ncbi:MULTISPECIES: hypothetical protein [unclassified Brenneria]|uniref:hypothetical protein n=1 Tax=unclassified Brenneria TaxID=2634434 RepID=UPI0029C47462|nr:MULTISPECIES: hypothetical protein [unclassified Brenneria]MDX5627317.1 hypothetical protein [Brenneria sp. L3-3Z]MDX5694527.1 hypothetical protein [Brenneria sp. L4-2C]
MENKKLTKTIWEEKERSPREYYSIKSAAKLLDCEEEELLRRHDNEEITLAVELNEEIPAVISFYSDTKLFSDNNHIIDRIVIAENNHGKERVFPIKDSDGREKVFFIKVGYEEEIEHIKDEDGTEKLTINTTDDKGEKTTSVKKVISITNNDKEKAIQRLNTNKDTLKCLIAGSCFGISKVNMPLGYVRANVIKKDNATFYNEIFGCFISGIWGLCDERDIYHDLCDIDGFYTGVFSPIQASNEKIKSVIITFGDVKTISIDELIITRMDVEKIYDYGKLGQSIPKSGMIENQKVPDEPKKAHGNKIRYEKNREDLLKAALFILNKYPQECRGKKKDPSPLEWAKALLAHGKDPDVPVFTITNEQTITRRLREYLSNTVK